MKPMSTTKYMIEFIELKNKIQRKILLCYICIFKLIHTYFYVIRHIILVELKDNKEVALLKNSMVYIYIYISIVCPVLNNIQ